MARAGRFCSSDDPADVFNTQDARQWKIPLSGVLREKAEKS